MQVYNTLGRSLQPLETRTPGEVAVYVCGPTVQSPPHVGHGRQAVAFDVIRRYLEWRGFRVRFVFNITDVEDKIIAAAAEQGVSPAELAEQATEQFLSAYRLLRVREPDALTYATEHIDEMLEMIGRLVDRGHAYAAGGDVYFSVRSLSTYGELSGRNIDELVSGARVEPGDQKRDPLDFALWKASKPGEPTWQSPWGPGRPGWHIECSAMAEKELGFGFDIHGGGLDLVFPHHENEIAQSEAARGERPFARYWLHNGMVRLRGDKMAKSLGNVVGLADLLDEHRPEAVRLFYLRAQYRQPIDFSPDLVVDAEAALDRLWAFRRRSGQPDSPADAEAIERFTRAMDDDFNTAEAMAVLFDVVREGNRHLDSGEDAGPHFAAFDVITGVLGLGEESTDLSDLAEPLAAAAAGFDVSGESAQQLVAGLIEARAAARRAADFTRADAIRNVLAESGVVLEDGPDGTTWHRR
ncbi:MAG: cysteine--tRNA ligase [Acidimicrobiia bacterium]